MALLSPSKASKLNHIFIHSVMSENDRNMPSIVSDFHTKLGKKDALSCSEEEISKFNIGNFESGKSLERKVHFFNSLETTKIFRSFKLSVYINFVLQINFPEQFKLCFYLKYSRSYKVL